MVKLIIMGPQGSGKGTYSSRMAPQLDNIPVISMGDLLRAARDDEKFGNVIKEAQDRGVLVSNEIVMDILKKRLEQEDAQKGFILDGFPRSLEQAEALEEITDIDATINLVVPREVSIARLSSRIQCKNCGKIYNKLYLKSKVDGVCDECDGELYQRDDDKPEAIEQRLKVYEEKTQPLIDFYNKKGIKIDIECNSVDIPPEFQVEKIMKALKEKELA